ncbi:MAG: cation transporter [Pyrinomonadaceae bacterium]|nr:cation transporter [Pyrinomonadaceae bacterium]
MATNILDKVGSFGAVFAAVASSLCCILPVVAIVFGLGAFGVASVFETLRPYFLILAVSALAFSFYRIYFRREQCADREACSTKPVGRFNQIVLWLAAVAVIAIAAFPYYTAYIVSAMSSQTAVSENNIEVPPTQNSDETAAIENELPNRKRVVIGVDGMTCEGCASQLNIALKRISGVIDAQASYPKKKVTVVYDPKQVTVERIKQGIHDAGYDPK